MSRKSPAEVSLSAEYLRISNCIYEENVTVILSTNCGMIVNLTEKQRTYELEILSEDVSQIGLYSTEMACEMFLSISEECLEQIESELELDELVEQRLIIIKLTNESSLDAALISLQELFASKITQLDTQEYHDAMETFFERSDPKLLLYPPPRARVRSIQLNRHDYKTIAIKTPLNDAIIDFYLRYLKEEEFTDDQKEKTHIFGTFFFDRLLSSGYAQVATWTRKVNIFEKDFILVPINQKNQWLLTIICFPSNLSVEKSCLNKACIVFFDSLATESWDNVAGTLREYLSNEYEAKFDIVVDFNARNMPHYHVNVPQQDNQYDSGLFILKYAELFFKEPITDYTNLSVLNKQLDDWFDVETIQSMRGDLSQLIAELVKEHNPKQLPMPKIDVEVIDITLNDD